MAHPRVHHDEHSDKSYGTRPFLTWLLLHGIAPHIPVLDRTHQTDGMFTRASFTYEADEDAWRCPAGCKLRRAGLERSTGMQKYLAREADCQGCALKPQCTTGKARSLSISIYEPAREIAQALAGTDAYTLSQRRRKTVEVLFAHLKQQLGIRRLRLRGLQGAAEEFHLAAAVQNLRRLAKLTARMAGRQVEATAPGGEAQVTAR